MLMMTLLLVLVPLFSSHYALALPMDPLPPSEQDYHPPHRLSLSDFQDSLPWEQSHHPMFSLSTSSFEESIRSLHPASQAAWIRARRQKALKIYQALVPTTSTLSETGKRKRFERHADEPVIENLLSEIPSLQRKAVDQLEPYHVQNKARRTREKEQGREMEQQKEEDPLQLTLALPGRDQDTWHSGGHELASSSSSYSYSNSNMCSLPSACKYRNEWAQGKTTGEVGRIMRRICLLLQISKGNKVKGVKEMWRMRVYRNGSEQITEGLFSNDMGTVLASLKRLANTNPLEVNNDLLTHIMEVLAAEQSR